MNPMTNSFPASRAILTADFVYDPVARLSLLDISARRRRARPRGRPTEERPEIIPGPGRGWAFVRWDQEAIWWTPDEYWRVTVLPDRSAL